MPSEKILSSNVILVTSEVRRHDLGTAVRKSTDYLIKDGRKGLAPERIGEVVWTALTMAKPRARYAPVPGKLLNWFLPTALPSRVVDRLIAGHLGLRPKSQMGG